jgi:hypothetical protein
MSDFSGEGFTSYPNMHLDDQVALRAVELSTEHLDYKMNQYGEFVQRTNLLPRHLEKAHKLLDRFIFEAACRDGVYDEQPTQEGNNHG